MHAGCLGSEGGCPLDRALIDFGGQPLYYLYLRAYFLVLVLLGVVIRLKNNRPLVYFYLYNRTMRTPRVNHIHQIYLLT